MSELAIEVTTNPDVTIVALAGSAGLEGSAELDRRLTAQSALRPRYLVLDFAGLSFISSLAMGSLIRLAQGMSRQGGKIAIASPQPGVVEALKRIRLESVIPMYPSLDAALAPK